MGKIVSGRQWIIVLVGQVPPEIQPEQMHALALQGVNVSGALLPYMQSIQGSVDPQVVQVVASAVAPRPTPKLV